MRYFLLPLYLLFFQFSNGQEDVYVQAPDGELHGVLRSDTSNLNNPIIYIIGGSGASTADGVGDSQKLLAEALWEKGIHTLSVDKRGAGKSSKAFIDEEFFRIDTLVNDAILWVNYLKEKGYTNIIIAGHSQGSLVGMLAAQKTDVQKFISLAGPGRAIDKVLKEQLSEMLPVFRDSAYSVLDGLAQGEHYDTLSPYLYSLFRPSIQPFMRNWMGYSPMQEISKLNIPVLIVQGSTDLQVSLEDAELLHKAKPNAEQIIIKGMNHVFRNAPMNKAKNQATYNDSTLPPNDKLIKALVKFVNR